MLSQRVSLTKLEILWSSERIIIPKAFCAVSWEWWSPCPLFQGCPRYRVRGRPLAPLTAQASYALEAQTGCD